MKSLVWGLIVILAIAHQDFWWWNDAETMVFGFVPVGLAYHALVSLLAGVLWALAVRYCWPIDLESDAVDPPVTAAGRREVKE